MGDRAPVQLAIYACPPEHEAAVLEVLNTYGLGEDWMMTTPLAELTLGTWYVDSEGSLGVLDDIGAAMPDAVTWHGWQDPAYEWLGDLHINVPGLGFYSADCDANGNPIVSEGEIITAIEAAPDLAHAVAAVRMAYGHPWRDKIAELMPPNEPQA